MPRVVPSYTILDPVLSDISQLVIRKEQVSDGQGGFTNELRLSAYYNLESNPSGVVVDQKFESYGVVLGGAVKTALVNFINANVIPGIKAQEGL